MATAAKLEQSASTSIATIVAQTPAVVLVDSQKREQLYDHIQREVDAFEPDVSTTKGRDAIKSLAYKITRTKTAIDAAGKELNEEARAKINAVDAARRDARERLAAMADAVRAPLTEWEEAEEERVKWCREVIQSFKAGAVVVMDDTSETVRERGKRAFEVIVSEQTFGDMYAEAVAAKETCIDTLKAALARLTKEEADRAELDRLRAEAVEREERERTEREAREAEEQLAAQAKAEQERREAAERAEAERIERAAKEAAENARREAEQEIELEREAQIREQKRMEAERQAMVDAANERAAKAEAEAQAERDAQIERDRLARQAEEAAAVEQERREKDQANRRRVKTAAKEAMMSCGASEEVAQKIVLAIIAGEIPAVTLRF